MKLKCITQITSASIEPEENLDSLVSLKRSNIKAKEELYKSPPINLNIERASILISVHCYFHYST